MCFCFTSLFSCFLGSTVLLQWANCSSSAHLQWEAGYQFSTAKVLLMPHAGTDHTTTVDHHISEGTHNRILMVVMVCWRCRFEPDNYVKGLCLMLSLCTLILSHLVPAQLPMRYLILKLSSSRKQQRKIASVCFDLIVFLTLFRASAELYTLVSWLKDA